MRIIPRALIMMLIAMTPALAIAQTPEAEDHVQETVATNSRELLTFPKSDVLTVLTYTVQESNNTLWVVVWNASNDDVTNPELKVNVRDSDGKLMGVATDRIEPTILKPGDIGLARVYLSGIDISDSLEYEMILKESPLTRANEMMPDIGFGDIAWTGTVIVGEMYNTGTGTMAYSSLTLACLSSDGEILGGTFDNGMDDFNPGEMVTFQTGESLYQMDCDNFILVGSLMN